MGCVPSIRVKVKGEACDEVVNYWASEYNQGLQVILQEFKSELEDFQYSYFNAYEFFFKILQKPFAYGMYL
ncbi:hypothetical protein RDABS01_007560 [Bienertia sinuspersici]